MSEGLYSAPSIAAASVPTPPSPLYTLFYDASNSNTPSIKAHTTGIVTAFGGLSQESIEDFLGLTDFTSTATITPSYNDPAGTFTWNVNANSLTNAMLVDMAQGLIKGRASGAGTGSPQDLTGAQVKTILAIVPADVTGFDESAQDAVGAALTDTATIDTTYNDGANTMTFDVKVNSIDNTFTADMVQATIKGRAVGAGTGDPTDLTATQATAIINDATLTTGTNLPGRLTAVEKTRINRDRDIVADGGADATGAVDATTVINSALALGGRWTVPVGVFKVNTSAVSLLMAVDGTELVGMSRRNSIIQPNHATQDTISITADECVIRNLRIQPAAAGTRTGGFAANFSTTSDTSGIEYCDIIQMWSGVKSSGPLQFVADCNIREVSQNSPFGGAAIFIDSPGDRYVRRVTSDSGANQTGNAGIRVKECSSVVISDSNLIHCGTCLDLDPTSTKTIASVKAVNCFFDTSTVGLSINGVAAAGSVYRSNFTACWFGSHTGNGVTMNGVAAGTAQFDGISFSHCEMYGNGSSGIACPLGGGAWTADACKIAGNSTGISFTPGTNHFPRIRNCEIGAYGNFGVNTFGISVGAGAYKGVVIQNNAVINNNLTLGAVTVGATEASFFRIEGNAGINPRGAVTTPAVPGTGVVTTNITGFRVTIAYKSTGTIHTGMTLNGVALAAPNLPPINTFATFQLDPGGTIVWTGGTAPTWVWYAN